MTAASEVTHGDAMRKPLLCYRVADPAPGPDGASATDPTFGGIYRELVSTGSRSCVDGLRVGAQIVELHIDDIHARR
jgi:hypothetical protein